MYMDKGMDTRDMIKKKKIEIGEEETTGEVWDKLAKIGGNLLVKTLKLIEEGKAPREKQGSDFTMAPMLSKEMAIINWQDKTAKEIHNLIRGLNPIMGAYSYLNGKKIKFWQSQVINKDEFINNYPEFKEYENKFNGLEPGTIIIADQKQGLYIKTKDDVLKIIEIQGENAKIMRTEDFLRGNSLMAGSMFEY